MIFIKTKVLILEVGEVWMIDHLIGSRYSRLRLVAEECFLVNFVSDIVEQASVVLSAVAGQIDCKGIGMH